MMALIIDACYAAPSLPLTVFAMELDTGVYIDLFNFPSLSPVNPLGVLGPTIHSVSAKKTNGPISGKEIINAKDVPAPKGKPGRKLVCSILRAFAVESC